MKKKLLFIVFCLFTQFATAQSVVKTENGKYLAYCEIVGTGKFLSTKVTIEVDFGQSKWDNAFLYGADGKKIKFNSMMDALDYMGKRNWKLVQAYALGQSPNFVYHYIMAKEVSSDNEITEGLDLKKD